MEYRGNFVVACGCSGAAHNEALLDICVAEEELAGCNEGAELGTGSTFHRMREAQAGLAQAVRMPDGACAHACCAHAALLSVGALSAGRAVPLVGSLIGIVVAAGGDNDNWCAFQVHGRHRNEQPLTIHGAHSGNLVCSCCYTVKRGACQHIREIVGEGVDGCTLAFARVGTSATPDVALFRGPRPSSISANVAF